MAAVTVKVPSAAHAALVEIASADKRSMGEVLAELIEQERRRRLFDVADAAYARLRADPEAWADDQAALRSMDGSLTDGLERERWIE